jgi:hypothetical protein
MIEMIETKPLNLLCLVLFAFLIIGCADELSQVRSHYENGAYALLERPDDKYCIVQFERAIAAGEKLLQSSDYNILEHDSLISFICLSHLGIAGYFRHRDDFLSEEEKYLIAIRSAAQYGKHLPFKAGPIYQGLQSVYRQEQIKRDCYMRLASLYERLDEPALSCIVRMQFAFAHAYLLSTFFAGERSAIQRYELQAQEKMDDSFRNDVVSGGLLFFVTIFYVTREASILAVEASGHISKERAQELSAEARSDYEHAIEKIETAHTNVEIRLEANFRDFVISPLMHSIRTLEHFPYLEKLDSYQKLRSLTEQIKEEAKSNYSRELISLLGRYQSNLSRLYQETRTARDVEIRVRKNIKEEKK